LGTDNRSPKPHPAIPRRRSRIVPTRWPEIAARAEYESLRDLAAVYRVSHETLRTVVGRVVLGGTRHGSRFAARPRSP
jgi:hypothetical protein